MIWMSDRYEVEILNKWGDSETYVDFMLIDKELGRIGHFCNWYDIEPTENEILNDIYFEASDWFKLPRTSEISDTMNLIFQELCQSENDMLFIEDEDKFDYYHITPTTYKVLLDEIKKYNLNDYFDINSDKITVYGGLQCAFNDDRNLYNPTEKVFYVTKEFIEKNFDLYRGINNSDFDLLIFEDAGKYVAIDDSSGHCFVEEFDKLEEANMWLTNESLSVEEIRKMTIPKYINRFIQEIDIANKDYANEL